MVDNKHLVTKDASFCFTQNSEGIQRPVPSESGSQQEPKSWAYPPFWQEKHQLVNHFGRLQEVNWFANA